MNFKKLKHQYYVKYIIFFPLNYFSIDYFSGCKQLFLVQTGA